MQVNQFISVFLFALNLISLSIVLNNQESLYAVAPVAQQTQQDNEEFSSSDGSLDTVKRLKYAGLLQQLSKTAKRFEISEKLQNEVLDAMKPVIRKYADSLGDEFDVGRVGFSLDGDLLESYYQVLITKIPQEETRFREELQNTKKFEILYRKLGKDVLLNFMGDYLSLSIVQETQVQKLLANYTVCDSEEAVELLMPDELHAPIAAFERLGDEFALKLKGLLTEAQVEVFEELETLVTAGPSAMYGSSFSEEEHQKWKDAFEAFADLRVEELKLLCDLDEKQVGFLKVATKGAISKTGENLEKLVKLLEDNPEMQGVGVETLVETGRSPMESLVCSPRWQKVLQKVLTKEQLKLVEERELIRTQAKRAQAINGTALILMSDIAEIQPSCEEYEKFVSLIEETVPADANHFYSVIFYFAGVDDEKLKPVFLGDNLELMQERMAEYRSEVELIKVDAEVDADE